MITKFIVGKSYKWIGPMSYSYNWNSHMDKQKDGSSRICKSIKEGVAKSISFYYIEGVWDYSGVFKLFRRNKKIHSRGARSMITKFIVGKKYSLDLEKFHHYLEEEGMDELESENILFENKKIAECVEVKSGIHELNIMAKFGKEIIFFDYNSYMLNFFKEENYIQEELEV